MTRRQDPAHDTDGAAADEAGRSVVVPGADVTAEDIAARRNWREIDGPRPAICALAAVAVSGRFRRERPPQPASVAGQRAARRNDRKAGRDWRSKPRGFKPGRAGLLDAIRRADDPPTAA